MSIVKQYRISTSLREKIFDLLSRYEPSDIAYTMAAALYDKKNKMEISAAHSHSKEVHKEMKQKQNCYYKGAKRLIMTSKSLKMLELEYLA